MFFNFKKYKNPTDLGQSGKLDCVTPYAKI